MREIKFRAWDKIHKEIKEVAIISWISRFAALWNVRGNVRITIDRDFGDIELMQYTGLKDKNGKEIYEGDILRITGKYFRKSIQENMLVEYDESKAWFGVVDALHTVDLGLFDCENDVEIVGNKWENPELLEGKE